nr:ribonuclease toxin immunity protein CdiI [Lysinibacillus sphaericus]
MSAAESMRFTCGSSSYTEVYSIVDYEMFFEYLLKVAQGYLSIYPQNRLIVVENITQIQKKFGIGIKK